MRSIPGLALALVIAAAAPAAAQEVRGVERVLLDRSLQERRITFTGIDGGMISYAEGGLVRTEPVSEYLALLPAPRIPRPAQPSLAGITTPAPAADFPAAATGAALELVDGQRLTGGFRDGAADSERFVWVSPDLGPFQLRIEDVAALRLGAIGARLELPRSISSDIVVLLNGDRLEGIIDRMGDPLVIAAGDAGHTLPLDRIAAVSLANPPVEPAGTYVWLEDGSIVAARSMHTTRLGEFQIGARLSPESEASQAGAASLPLDRIRAINFDVERLIPLASLEPLEQEATGERRWSREIREIQTGAPLGASDLLLPGPMAVSWSLPEGAARFAAAAELPRESWTWGDLELVVEHSTPAGETTQLARHRLNAERPLGLINAEIPVSGGGTLVVRVEAGAYGPVQDRVILRRPLLSAGEP